MSGIFFSYRRSDSLAEVQGMHAWFVQRLPLPEVYFDLVSIRSGEDFPDRIESFIRAASVVLVIIGPDWADARDDAGNRRLDNPADWVRREVALALELGKPIIPVLLGGANLPDAGQLPTELRPLRERKNAHRVRPGLDFAADMAKLATDIAAHAPDDFLLSRSPDGATVLLFSAAERRVYLEWVIASYGQIALPFDPEGRFPLDLNTIFQPLELRRDPLLAEEIRRREERRALLGDPTVSEDDPRYRRDDPDREKPGRRPDDQDRDGRDVPAPPRAIVTAADGDDALKQSPNGRMVVLGGPGTGKTTLLRRLITEAAQRALADTAAPLPIFLSLPAWGASGQTLETYFSTLLTDREVWLHERRHALDAADAWSGLVGAGWPGRGQAQRARDRHHRDQKHGEAIWRHLGHRLADA